MNLVLMWMSPPGINPANGCSIRECGCSGRAVGRISTSTRGWQESVSSGANPDLSARAAGKFTNNQGVPPALPGWQ